jgi:glucosyl-3-phosphoglycerate synthase
MAVEGARSYRVLLVLEERIDPTEAQKGEITRLIRAAQGLGQAQSATGLTLLSLIPVEEGQSLSEGAQPAQNQRALLDQLAAPNHATHQFDNLEVKTSVRVCSASELAQELNDFILENQIDLALLEARWFDGAEFGETEVHSPLEEVLRRPLCDMAIIGPGVDIDQSNHLLLAARGGPFAELALRLATGVAEQTNGEVTLLHVVRADSDNDGLDDLNDDTAYADLLRSMTPAQRQRVQRKQVIATSAQEAIVSEAQEGYNLVLLGASMNIGATQAEALLQNPFGPVARAVLDRVGPKSRKAAGVEIPKAGPGVIIVRTRAPQDFYFARLQRRKQQAQARMASEDYISRLVDKWFAENTFDSEEFGDIERLLASKKSQGLTISLGLPALNEEATVGEVISTIKEALYDKCPLLDEIVLIDSQSTDRTVAIAKELGIPVYVHQEVLKSTGARRGKGEALWKSLYVLKGDIICWIDTDIKNVTPRFIYGLVGPLLKEPRIQYVKGYYRRPIQVGDKVYETGGGRVTELTIRPLFNLFFPELSGMIQPLAGEYAGRRSCLEQLPFFTGYGVETGHLIDVLERFGLSALGQVNLRERHHRNQELGALSQMAFAITQVVMKRLEERERLHLTEDVNRTMKLISLGEQGLRLDVRHIEDRERPPMLEIPEYRQKHRKRLIRTE